MDQAKPVQEEMLYLTLDEGRALLRKLQTKHISFDFILREYVVWVVLQACIIRLDQQMDTPCYHYHTRSDPLLRKAVRFLESHKLVNVIAEDEEDLVFIPVLEEHQLWCEKRPGQCVDQVDAANLQDRIRDHLKEYTVIREVLRDYVLPILLQSCSAERTEDGKVLYSTDALMAYADAARLLERFGFVKIVDEISCRFVLFEVVNPNMCVTS